VSSLSLSGNSSPRRNAMNSRRAIFAALLALAIAVAFTLPALADDDRPSARPSADWVKSGVIYELNLHTFSASGDFKGAEARLDKLHDLGVTILWLMPIHPAGKLKAKGTYGSPYAVQDYYAVSPDFGTKDDFRHFVNAAHAKGFKVIIDIVANHTAWDSVMMKHPEWYKQDAKGNVIPPVPEWTDVAGLNYKNPELRRYMTDMLKYWMKDFDLDGYRCDVAEQVPTDFWENARADLEKIKPNMMMLAEGNKPELLVKAFDLDYSWPLLGQLNKVIMRGEPASSLIDNVEREHARYPKGAMQMRITDDHDETRAVVRYGERGALAAAAFTFTLDGVPVLYNGMEVGDASESGDPALFENIKVVWQIANRRPYQATFFPQMVALRKAHPALQQGETEWLHNSAQDRVVTYLRRGGGEKGEEFFIAVNFSNQPFNGTVDASAGDYTDLTPEAGFEHKRITLPALTLGAFEFRIYQVNRVNHPNGHMSQKGN